MRRFAVLLSVVTAVLVSLVTTGGLRTVAQDATPAAAPAAAPNFIVGELAPIGEQFELIPGIDVEFLNQTEAAGAPGQTLVLYRVIARGGEVPWHRHPGTSLLTVESGTFSSVMQTGTAWVTRPGAAPEQVTEPGTELVLQPGEGLSYSAEVVHNARAAGDEPASVLVAGLLETGQPVFTLTDEQGTPTP
jgi:quercetin dioxygenase-like cupin family protein